MSIDTIEEILNTGIAEAASRNYTIEMCLKPGADDTSLDATEVAIGVPIPADYRELLKWSNGMTLSVNRNPRLSADLYISGLRQLLERGEHYAEWFSEDSRAGTVLDERGAGSAPTDPYWQRLLVLASYGAGVCLLDVSRADSRSYTVIDLDPEVEAGTGTQPIAADLEEWFRLMMASAVNRGSLIYWLPDADDPDAKSP